MEEILLELLLEITNMLSIVDIFHLSSCNKHILSITLSLLQQIAKKRKLPHHTSLSISLLYKYSKMDTKKLLYTSSKVGDFELMNEILYTQLDDAETAIFGLSKGNKSSWYEEIKKFSQEPYLLEEAILLRKIKNKEEILDLIEENTYKSPHIVRAIAKYLIKNEEYFIFFNQFQKYREHRKEFVNAAVSLGNIFVCQTYFNRHEIILDLAIKKGRVEFVEVFKSRLSLIHTSLAYETGNKEIIDIVLKNGCKKNRITFDVLSKPLSEIEQLQTYHYLLSDCQRSKIQPLEKANHYIDKTDSFYINEVSFTLPFTLEILQYAVEKRKLDMNNYNSNTISRNAALQGRIDILLWVSKYKNEYLEDGLRRCMKVAISKGNILLLNEVKKCMDKNNIPFSPQTHDKFVSLAEEYDKHIIKQHLLNFK